MAGTTTKQKNLLCLSAANIDYHYGPWESIDAYEQAIRGMGFASVLDGVSIMVKAAEGSRRYKRYVMEDGSWVEDTGDFVETSSVGQAGGVAPLGDNGVIDAMYLPQYVSEVQMYATKMAFPGLADNPEAAAQPSRGVIYVDQSTNLPYRYGGSDETSVSENDYVEVSQSLALDVNGIGSPNMAYPANMGKASEEGIRSLSEDMLELKESVEEGFEALKEEYVEKNGKTDNEVYVVVNGSLVKKDVLVKEDVVNDLGTDNKDKPLAAAQGFVLNGKMGALSNLSTDSKTNLVEAINEIYRKSFRSTTYTIKIKVTSKDADPDMMEKLKSAYVEVYDFETENINKFYTGSCSNGEREFTTQAGKKFIVKFASVGNLVVPSDMTVQALNNYNEIVGEYAKPTIYNSETVAVRLLNYSTENMNVAGQRVEVTEDDGKGYQSKITDANGLAEFSMSNRNAGYTVKVPKTYSEEVEGQTKMYNCTGSNEYKSEVTSLRKDVIFTYREEGMGVLIVNDDGKEYHYSNWIGMRDIHQKAAFVRFASEEYNFLVCLNHFYAHFNNTEDNIFELKGAIFTQTSRVFTDFPQGKFDGYGRTQYIKKFHEEGRNSPILQYILDGKVDAQLNGQNLLPYIPTADEIDVVITRINMLNAIYQKRYGEQRSCMLVVSPSNGNVNNQTVTSTKADNNTGFIHMDNAGRKAYSQIALGRLFPFYKDGGSV